MRGLLRSMARLDHRTWRERFETLEEFTTEARRHRGEGRLLVRICCRSSCDFANAVNIRPKFGRVIAAMIRGVRDFAAASAVFANFVILLNQPPILRVSVSPWCNPLFRCRFQVDICPGCARKSYPSDSPRGVSSRPPDSGWTHQPQHASVTNRANTSAKASG